MGYCCTLGETNFKIAKKGLNLKDIIGKIILAFDVEDFKDKFSYICKSDIIDLKSESIYDLNENDLLVSIFKAFNIELQEYGEYYEPVYLMFDGKLTYSEELFYSCFVGYVDQDSYLTYYGEDGEQWRYVIRDNKVTALYPNMDLAYTDMSDKIIISKLSYASLKESESRLQALKNYGVDNWCGYGDALSEWLEEAECESFNDIYNEALKE